MPGGRSRGPARTTTGRSSTSVPASIRGRSCVPAVWRRGRSITFPPELPALCRMFGGGRSPYLDLSDGFEAYVASRRERSDVRNALGKTARKLAREIGPVRFVLESDATELLALLIEWKRRQYAETGVRDVLADAGSRELLERMHAVARTGVRRALSALYAGDEVAALQFGVRSARVWHCWFPAYNRDLAGTRPGSCSSWSWLGPRLPSASVRSISARATPRTSSRSRPARTSSWKVASVRVPSRRSPRGRESARRALRHAGMHRAVRRAMRSIRARRRAALTAPLHGQSHRLRTIGRATRVCGPHRGAVAPPAVSARRLEREERSAGPPGRSTPVRPRSLPGSPAGGRARTPRAAQPRSLAAAAFVTLPYG